MQIWKELNIISRNKSVIIEFRNSRLNTEKRINEERINELKDIKPIFRM